MDILSLINRSEGLLVQDLVNHEKSLKDKIKNARFLVIGAGGTIGQAVCREIFKRKPAVIHAVDINENSLVELVRDIRSSLGYLDVDFQTFAIDCSSLEFSALCKKEGNYDYVFNLSALKHVRNEKDPYTLMRMIRVNILNTIKTLDMSRSWGSKKYFCVSTDKAANPVNMMGASKSIMEMFLMRNSIHQKISTARFANVAFSDGSLLNGFRHRIEKKQPISAPRDIKRYFVTPQESGQICIFSGLLADNREIYFPNLNDKEHLHTFSDIATRYLNELGYEPYVCDTEGEARKRANELISKKYWPCYFFDSDTTGEKKIEEFYSHSENINFTKYKGLGVINKNQEYSENKLELFLEEINRLLVLGNWSKEDLVRLFIELIPDFDHIETGKNLDQRM